MKFDFLHKLGFLFFQRYSARRNDGSIETAGGSDG
jgi:hypothetical protein